MKKIFPIVLFLFLTTTFWGTEGTFAGGHKYIRRPAPSTTVQTEPKQPVKINDIYVIHFVIDGVNRQTFDNALSEGRLPTIKDCFVEKGAVFTHALSNFPSTSTTVYQSFASGLLPGHAGIPHLERFDRQKGEVIGYLTVGGSDMVNSDFINLTALLKNPDVDELETPSTIFELLERHPTAGVYTLFYRGASYAHPERAPIQALWVTYITGKEEKVDVLALGKVSDLFEKDLDAIPRYTLAGLYSADIFGHKYGPDSEEVTNTLIQFDNFLRDFFTILEKRGIADKTYIIISGDHGMHETGQLFRLQKALEAKGIFAKPKNPKEKGYSIYAANRGVVSSHLYVRHSGGFEPVNDPSLLRHHPTRWGEKIDLVDTILKLDATDLLIVRAGERKVRIYNHDGRMADISCYTLNSLDYCSYDFDKLIGDPLGYVGNATLSKLLDGQPHSTLEWREATAGERYPDAVIQLSQIFQDGRAGDAFITTRDRYGFRKVKQGNHGGPTNEDMLVPLLITGPTVPRGTFGIARATDIYPIVTQWFGLSVPPKNYDGINPFERGVPENTFWQKLAALEHILSKAPPLYKMVGAADFVREKVHPAVPPSIFKKLLPLAKEELHRRTLLAKKLKGTGEALNKQRTDDKTPKVAGDEYLDDHISIVNRMRRLAQQQLQEIEDAISVLANCSDTFAIQCQHL